MGWAGGGGFTFPSSVLPGQAGLAFSRDFSPLGFITQLIRQKTQLLLEALGWLSFSSHFLVSTGVCRSGVSFSRDFSWFYGLIATQEARDSCGRCHLLGALAFLHLESPALLPALEELPQLQSHWVHLSLQQTFVSCCGLQGLSSGLRSASRKCPNLSETSCPTLL